MEIPNDKDEIENVISLNNSSVKKHLGIYNQKNYKYILYKENLISTMKKL